ncbi:hypothetical protein EXIGLDRAFT_622775 [Exidia glandulosa HHB12029]|uniref:Transposase family Tnp2 protein n=1 Tax=Exidia glandulosa HHB12029 TaxID=1314781 RepID=A0A165DYF3_EXIGL|nr:hypothetical protein EXIGLDRAFT_622775 [Exidia glandulosa HHB12029]
MDDRPDVGSLAYDRNRHDHQNDEEDLPDTIDLSALPLSRIPDVAILQQFNSMLRSASYDNCDLTEVQLEHLLNPSREMVELDPEEDRLFILCLRTYMTCKSGSYRQYTEMVENMREAFPEKSDGLLSLDQLTRRIERVTGIVEMRKDMCPKSCVGFTGPWSSLTACPICFAPRYDAEGKPLKTFTTIPLPQQVQAMRRHPDTARDARYFWDKVEEIQQLIAEYGFLPEYDDIVCGSEIRETIRRGDIGEDDTIVMSTIDGAQLYRNKTSDCWMYGWVVVNFSPDRRYKQRYLLPGGFIGGPEKPKIFDSYLYPGLHIISAVNNAGGLPVWDAYLCRSYLTKLFIAYAMADGPGSTAWSSLVPHHGKIGCRLWCGMLGRHKPGCPHYYPATLKPLDYAVEGCDHDDVDLHQFRGPNAAAYAPAVQFVTGAPTVTQYNRRRRETGITGTSPFMGLAPNTVIGPPRMFPLDIMHFSLNWGDLLLSLWRGTIDCGDSDSRNSWDFAVFRDALVWTLHGEDVARSTLFIPSLFGNPPRNIAEKLNSGYKAWEFVLYLWRLGPGLLLGVLPNRYWRSFCKLVSIVRFCEQKTIRRSDLLAMYDVSLDFIKEFETQYYQRRADRLHFIRPIVHTLAHLIPEILRVGPAACVSQWTMERFIGLVTADLKQHVTPYANIAARGVERAKHNALSMLFPKLFRKEHTTATQRKPRGAKLLGSGYVLLRAKESRSSSPSPAEAAALEQYLRSAGIDLPLDWTPTVQRWARLQLPNGQVVRSAWKECLKAPDALRRARDIRLSIIPDQIDYAEVRYYFQYNLAADGLDPNIRTLAMVSMCTRPDIGLLSASSGTLWSCTHQGDAGLLSRRRRCRRKGCSRQEEKGRDVRDGSIDQLKSRVQG